MRLGVAVAVACLSISVLSAAEPAQAAVRQATHIPPQALGTALEALAKQRRFQIVYLSEAVDPIETVGASGELTPDEALMQLLRGTGLTFRYLDETTVTVYPTDAPKTMNGSAGPQGGVVASGPRALQLPQSSSSDALQSTEKRRSLRQGVRVAQAQKLRSADDAEGSAPSNTTLEEITVRGKPFTDANVDIVRTENDAQPYYIFKSEDIAKANTANLEDFLKQRLTMNTTSTTNSQSAWRGAGGNSSTVNLRGLGTDQTLILVNGRRVSGNTSSPAAQQFDINALSPSIIERIEVLPASASAIYGGSAVGGVLNVILKRDFTGGDIQLTYDTPMDANAPIRSVVGGYGWSLEDGRTNITLSASYRDNDTLLYRDRPELVQRGISHILARNPSLLYTPSAPAFGSAANIGSADGSALVFKNDGSALGGTSLGSPFTYVPAGVSGSTAAAELWSGLRANAGQQNTVMPDAPGGQFRNAQLTQFSKVGDAKALTGAIRRKMTERLELIGEVFYSVNRAEHTEGAEQAFRRWQIPASSPINPFQQAINVVVPLPQSVTESDRAESLRAVAGFVLDLPNEWRLQGDYTWNRSEGYYDVGYLDGATGTTAIQAALAAGTFNPLVDTLSYPPDLAQYLEADDRLESKGVATLADVGLRVSGAIGHLPAGAPNLTLGLGHRKEMRNRGYNDFAGLGLQTYLPQSQRIFSIYAEGLVPLIAPANEVRGVRALDLQIASRWEDFSVAAGTDRIVTFPPDHAVDPSQVFQNESIKYDAFNSTVGLRYKPVDSVMIRTSYATAFLPPRYSDLLPGIPLPNRCCQVDPRRGNEAVFPTTVAGGNPDLEPLESETLSAGIIFEPRWLEGMRLGLEWFQIKRDNLIFNPTGQQLLDNESTFPERVIRSDPQPGDPFGIGPVSFMDMRALNTQHVSTEGFDFNIGYRWEDERLGIVNVDLLGTIIDKFTRNLTVDSAEEDIAGQILNGGPLKVRASAMVGWERGPWYLSWASLYYGPYDQSNEPRYILAQGTTTIPSQIYHNVLATYRFGASPQASIAGEALSNLTITLGIRNLFNSVPPIDVAQSQVQFYAPFGDYRLRSVQLSVGKKF